MSTFGSYFVVTLLSEMGWPRRKSFFNSTAIVDSIVADTVVDQMLDWATAIGACRPQLALQAVANVYKDRNWDGPDAPNILAFIDASQNTSHEKTNLSHRNIRGSFLFAKHTKSISVTQLKDDTLRNGLETMCVEGFIWGLANPDTFRTWFESSSSEQREQQFPLRQAGVEIDSWLSLDDFLNDCEKMLAGYENAYGSLPQIPSKLLADARTIRKDIVA